ncbi:Ser/Thr protein phosphatase, putative [Trichomonas vaginalis G3]|uniref:Ser/Thr protein phosphatase, putative n=1 Tax=Trichomonas vaginalis (strain ATCC PRA-98 / G3) TaxID=412133 RepID=A2DXN4_TRIV3|nr:calcineurin-like phosphoesterase family [Trichomonas vaginalis G3]EAY14863.1 Ser/Thr protein phosphatase, putative [Trichomonas vaginalis G3]KAI5541156.1 calcineurin-like phosphoesterase family [Trichomonas vaginalis G3]|eukprot:XP_001327086.1 Ser/Thr protein phosphatase [Trichomonas vaginalis G3]
MDHEPKKCKLCLSKYMWIVLILVPTIIRLVFPIKYSSLPIQGLDRQIPFDNNSDPNYFAVMTDVHVWYDQRDRHYEEGLEMARKLKSKYVVIAGDLVNNWKPGKKQVSSRNYQEHEMYHNITRNASQYFTTILDISGNHDMWDISSFDSAENDFPQYSNYYSKIKNLTFDEFACSIVYIDDNAFILLNPMRFPLPRSVYDFYTHLDKHFLDMFEKAVHDASNATHIYALLHFPVCFLIESSKSSSGKSFIQILSESRVTFLITGHTHPPKTSPIHHKNATEIIACDITTHAVVGIITEDNGNSVYHTFNTKDEVKALVVNPPPYDQIGGQSYFNDNQTNVKVLAFTNDSNTEILVDGIKMKFNHFVKDGLAVYTAMLPAKQGKYSLHFTGFFEKELECFNGKVVGSRKENPGIIHSMFVLGYILLGFFSSIMVFVLFPFDLSNQISILGKLRKRIEIWLISSTYCSFDTLIFTIFGFVVLRTRLLLNPLWLRLVLFFVLIIMIFVPFGFTKFDGKQGFVSMFGYFSSGKLMVEPSGAILFDSYMILIVFANIFLSAMVNDYTKFSLLTVVDLSVIIIQFVGNCMLINVFITQLVGVAKAWTSITWMFTPGILFSLILVNRIINRKKRVQDSLTADNLNPSTSDSNQTPYI